MEARLHERMGVGTCLLRALLEKSKYIAPSRELGNTHLTKSHRWMRLRNTEDFFFCMGLLTILEYFFYQVNVQHKLGYELPLLCSAT